MLLKIPSKMYPLIIRSQVYPWNDLKCKKLYSSREAHDFFMKKGFSRSLRCYTSQTYWFVVDVAFKEENLDKISFKEGEEQRTNKNIKGSDIEKRNGALNRSMVLKKISYKNPFKNVTLEDKLKRTFQLQHFTFRYFAP